MKILAELIKEAGIRKSYFLYGRSDTIVKNPDIIKIWKDIGLERVFVGLEFFRNEDLKYINKGSTVDFQEFMKYCRRVEGLSFLSFAVLTPLPGTDFYEEVKDSLITTDYDLFDFIHTQLPTKLPLKEFFINLNSLYFDTKSPTKNISLRIMKYDERNAVSGSVKSV